jgi:prophage regulatory protein
MAEKNSTAPTILRRKKVQDRTGLSRSTIYDRISKGEFPAPIRLSAHSVGWIESEIFEWVEQRIRASRPADKEVR